MPFIAILYGEMIPSNAQIVRSWIQLKATTVFSRLKGPVFRSCLLGWRSFYPFQLRLSDVQNHHIQKIFKEISVLCWIFWPFKLKLVFGGETSLSEKLLLQTRLNCKLIFQAAFCTVLSGVRELSVFHTSFSNLTVNLHFLVKRSNVSILLTKMKTTLLNENAFCIPVSESNESDRVKHHKVLRPENKNWRPVDWFAEKLATTRTHTFQ